MEIILPENISEITLKQFLKYEELIERNLDTYNFNKRKIEIFTGIPFNKIDKVKAIDTERILSQIDLALSIESEFTNRFSMHNIEFGFIPNFDKISIGEFADLSTYGVSKETLNKLMAVLFRPVINTKGDSYEIIAYQGTEEYAEIMKDMPLHCVNGALVFFYNLANELQEATQKYLTEELVKDTKLRTTSRILDGTQRLKSWLKTTYLK
jgi:hypothetical protein